MKRQVAHGHEARRIRDACDCYWKVREGQLPFARCSQFPQLRPGGANISSTCPSPSCLQAFLMHIVRSPSRRTRSCTRSNLALALQTPLSSRSPARSAGRGAAVCAKHRPVLPTSLELRHLEITCRCQKPWEPWEHPHRTLVQPVSSGVPGTGSDRHVWLQAQDHR